MNAKMIFEDPSRRRWNWTRSFSAMGLLALALLALSALLAALIAPTLPGVRLFHAGAGISGTLEGPLSPGQSSAALMPVESLAETPTPAAAPAAVPSPAKPSVESLAAPGKFLRTAFLVQSDPRSLQALRFHKSDLDILFPDFFECSSADGKLSEWVDPAAARLLSASSAAVMPRLCNADNNGVWKNEEIVQLFQSESATRHLIDQLIPALRRLHAAGVNVDIENLSPEDKDDYLEFLSTLATALHAAHLSLVVDVPLNDTAFDYEVIGKLSDLVILMAYDEHFPTSKPGSVSSMPWFCGGVDDMATRIPHDKLIVALGSYGYDWIIGSGKDAEAISFAEAMLLAADHNADIETDDDARSPFFRYTDDAHHQHEVHFQDAVTAWNQSLEVRKSNLRGLSLWRLGLEEPALWSYLSLGNAIDSFDPRTLTTVPAEPVVSFKGDGELLRVLQRPENGVRRVDIEKENPRAIEYAAYTSLPHYFSVERRGRTQRNLKKIALTFDDGPDPASTPALLSLLKSTNTPATFFLVGDQARKFPDLVRQELAAGHVLGNHTLLHPNIEECSESRLRIELNTTQRIIEAITHRQCTLFRAPFDVDTSPTRPSQLNALATASSLDYIVAGADIDPTDYRRPGTDRIVHDVLTQIESTQGHIVLLHDGGGDRTQTIAAVARLIPELRARGYELVTVADLMESTPAQVMPAAPTQERFLTFSTPLLQWSRTAGWSIIRALFLATTLIAAARIALLGVLVLLRRRQHNLTAPTPADFAPPVTVLIPAYNEQTVIARTVLGVLASHYPGPITALVIDDGSSDATAERALELTLQDDRVRVLRKPNAGKSSALNAGLQRAETDIVVTIDADTIILPDTLRHLVAPFANPAVTAVCGNVMVGNVTNLLTAFQDVEYVTSQNYDRRAFESVNCISVVPGATGAWRRQAVLDVGGYSLDTLTEDADLTLAILRAGGKIAYAEEARSVTEAPQTVRALFKQRFRWSYGTFQCFWKHRAAFGHGSLGVLALPNMLFFQVLFPLLSPIGDLVLLYSLLTGQFSAIAIGYLTFLVMDLIGSAVAFHLERRPLTHIGTVFIQRFFYRQFMYTVALRSMLAALRGSRHGWNKLDRLNTVRTTLPAPKQSPSRQKASALA